jgi:hypothetical protein
MPIKMVQNNYENCPICFEEINDLLITSCQHKFCKNCIEEWLKIKCDCPLCRTKLISSNRIIPHNVNSLNLNLYAPNPNFQVYIPNIHFNHLLISSGSAGLMYSN